ncbi:MAG TPA: hypothetical protein VIA80_13850 [Hyphomonadaceae bacterium]|jgi:hypothetical protein
MGLWTRKPIESAHEGNGPKLRRSLGPLHLVALGVGAGIYAGMHVWRGRKRVAA